MRDFIPLKIKICCAYLPKRKILNSDLFAHLPPENLTLLNIEKYTGILARRYAQEGESCSDLAYLAVKYCLKEEQKQKVNALLLATTSGDYPSPASAHILHEKLQLSSLCHCLDIASSCSSFLSVIRASKGFLQKHKETLLLASEVKHPSLDTADQRTTSLFGDGAGGLIVTKEKAHGSFFSFCFSEVNSSLSKNIIIPVGGSRTPSNRANLSENKLKFFEPKKMYQEITKSIVRAVEHCSNIKKKTLKKFMPDLENIPGLIYIHQANGNILKEVKARVDPLIAI
ncbi:MAG: hypothetical protein K2X39_04725, partial [Silvanigrellaceae bacterium]|nr:hypothetical protein [Silvanigrellaceae bacterium]